MLDRIEMDSLDVPDGIVPVSNLVFPKTTLPHRFLLFAQSEFSDLSLIRDGAMVAEMTLDQPPTGGKVSIANGQRSQAMNVFRQDHDGIDRERVIVHRIAE